MDIQLILQLIIVVLALYFGTRYGSLAIGAISGVALAILVFGFHLKAGSPPTDVIYIILAAVTCAGLLHASGGMDWLIQIAERILRKHPERVTILAPFLTFLLTVMVGTGHVMYTLMPIICDVSLKKGIRPERPCAVASIASQVGITCSPIAAAVVAFSAISALYGYRITNIQLVMLNIPACILGLLAAVAYSWKRGLDLDKDPKFQALIKDPEKYNEIYGNNATTLDKKIAPESKRAVYIFLAAIAVIIAVSISSMTGVNVLPSYDKVQPVSNGAPSVTLIDGTEITAQQLTKGEVSVENVTEIVKKPLAMNIFIQIVMVSAAALMIIFCKVDPKKAVNSVVWQNGMVAVFTIYGIAWMSDTFIMNHLDQIRGMLENFVSAYPWAIAIVFALASILIASQGGVVVSILPLAYTLHIEPWVLIGAMPCLYAYFFLPTYPTDLATVNFDRSGTTHIGKYLLNHSFMLPGLIHTFVATASGLGLSYIFHFYLGVY